ncbi:hypothetical protein BDV35DRAFT_115882 [Aspergillus flavus]|uniref:Uncharacterized protein n=1 Tax=Aspergillus flavus TaxID=5059 RepID=A0A5N6H6Y0_ASPFL|nr:hypothetical protein BDV35DRAFT_115882 [Aspergillus flavus]
MRYTLSQSHLLLRNDSSYGALVTAYIYAEFAYMHLHIGFQRLSAWIRIYHSKETSFTKDIRYP